MRKDIDHLPAAQRGELDRVQGVLMDEFAEAIAKATSPSRKNGKILKVILFGSYARDDWVDEPENGYQSDFDLLVVVNHSDLTDIAHYWYVAEDRILRDAAIQRPVNIIVHALDEVNQSLKRGEYFWVDIARDGNCTALYRKASLGLLVLGLPPTLLLMVIAPWLFSTFLGPKWVIAGEVARILAPMLLLQLICSPVSSIMLIVGHQAEDFWLQAGFAIFTFALTAIAMLTFREKIYLIYAYSVAQSLMYVTYLVRCWQLSLPRQQRQRS